MTLRHVGTRAFTLVELSVVLAILGLLVGSVLGGQSLIHAAELRSVSTEYNRWMTAVNNFQTKYNAIPGDMATATSVWGVADASACALTSTGDARTCNGNGDGYLNEHETGNIGNEEYRFWQELANAGFIAGNFSGIRWYQADDGPESDQANNTQAGYNSPTPKMANSSWSVVGIASGPSSSLFDLSMFSIDMGRNVMVFGQNINWGPSTWPNLTPADAWSIDNKTDDGKPATGKVTGQYGNTCTTGASSASDTANAVYNVNDTGIDCFLTFIDVF